MLKIFTHHKTGTAFWSTCIKKLSEAADIRFYKESHPLVFEGDTCERYQGCAIYINTHCKYSKSSIKESTNDGIHSYRNPTRIWVSSCKYHLKSKEEWLHIPQEKFNGLTYQEKLKSYKSFNDQLSFELNHSAGNIIKKTIKALHELPYMHIDLDLIGTDKTLSQIKLIHTKTSLGEIISLKEFLKVVRPNCIWNMNQMPKHGTSAKEHSSEYYQKLISEENKMLFKEKFGEEVYYYSFD